MDKISTPIPGCYEIPLRKHQDQRGSFVKTFNSTPAIEAGLLSQFREIYHSYSHRGVLRGLHFQTPPHDHAKAVTCLSGSVFDVVLDLRKRSPTYLKWHSFQLSSATPTLVWIPRGCAHGFYVNGDHGHLLYLVETEHSPQHDTGIRWDSASIEWPIENGTPLTISDRDAKLTTLDNFETPFAWTDK